MAASTWDELRGSHMGWDGRRKLTEEDVVAIRERYRSRSHDANTYTLADEYGLDNTTVHKIVTEQTYVKPPRKERDHAMSGRTFESWARARDYAETRIAACEARRAPVYQESRWAGACPCCGSPDPRRCLTLDEMTETVAA